MIHRMWHFDRRIMELLPRKIRTRRATDATRDEISNQNGMVNDGIMPEEQQQLNHGIDEDQANESVAIVNHQAAKVSRRRATSPTMFKRIKSVPFSNRKPKK